MPNFHRQRSARFSGTTGGGAVVGAGTGARHFEPVSAPRHGGDVVLARHRKRAPQFADALHQRVIGDDEIGPHGREQFFFRHQRAGAFDQEASAPRTFLGAAQLHVPGAAGSRAPGRARSRRMSDAALRRRQDRSCRDHRINFTDEAHGSAGEDHGNHAGAQPEQRERRARGDGQGQPVRRLLEPAGQNTCKAK